MKTSNDDTPAMKSGETMFRIIETLRKLGGARISEIAEETGIAKSTIHRHLKTLKAMEYVVQEGDTYSVGLKFLRLGEHARRRKDLFELARSEVDELADATGEQASFMTEEHGRAVYLIRGIGSRAVQTDSSIGTRTYLHATAAGKALLSGFPEARVEEIVDRWGLPALTENTITDFDTLLDELAEVRDRGWSVNEGESTPGLNAVGVPVHDVTGGVAGALTVAGPSHRMKGEHFESEIPDLLLEAANELELKNIYS